MTSKSDRKLTCEEVAQHNTESDCWIIIDGAVYDVTKFLKVHPGGKGVILGLAGRDVTSDFYDFHARDILEKFGPKLYIGRVSSVETVHVPDRITGDLVTPFAEPPFVRGWKSPYYSEKHLKFRLSLREFIIDTLIPLLDGCEENNEDPSNEAFLAMGKFGMIAARVGPCAIPFLGPLGIKFPANMAHSDLDYFMESITNYTSASLLTHGVADGLGAGLTIGIPPIIHFGSKKLKEKFVGPILLGQSRVCLAISEPGGGSDVAGMTTTAVLNEAKTHYLVNGIKKWITGGTVADVFVTAVRTGKPGHGGLSFLVIERGPGMTTSRIKTSYSGAAGTALVVFENVLVPRENLLGPENGAFKMIMANFNHERWMIVHNWLGKMRTIVADCYRWSMGRKAFGKRLIDQPVIRYKLAEISAGIESLEAWTDSITYQMDKMSYAEQATELAVPIALLKFHTTRSCVQLADHAAQIFGGRGVTKTGMGKNVEQFVRGYKIVSIYGGSEEVLADVAVRQQVARLEALIAKGDKGAIVMSRL